MKLLRLLLPLTAVVAGAAPSPAPPAPKITSTSPAFWAVNVNAAAQSKITLTFDQPMHPAFSAWLGRSSVAPEIDLNSTMTPDRTSVSTSVKLQPGRVYVLALNEKKIPGVGFQNDNGISAQSYYLVFQTLGTPKPEDAPPVLVRCAPANGATIDPAKTAGITLFFDKPMKPDKQGLHLFENNAPVDLSKARFAYSPDGKSFTLYCGFKPSTSYRVELNSVNDIGFASKNRIPLWPLQFAFNTAR